MKIIGYGMHPDGRKPDVHKRGYYLTTGASSLVEWNWFGTFEELKSNLTKTN